MTTKDITVDGNLTNNTTPATTDRLLLVDAETNALQDITLENLLKVINDLTAEASPVTGSDYVVIYSASSGAPRKVLPDNLFKVSPTAFKNKIINGRMEIDQRNAGVAVTINAASYAYTLDRWAAYGQATDGVFTVQRDTIVPTGFVNSLKVTITTADSSIAAGQTYVLEQKIEGVNVYDLAWGTASAKTATLSFWVRASVTGNYSVSIRNSATNRSYVATFSIISADTFEYKTIVIPGDTTGTWLTDTGIGVRITFTLGAGSNYQTSSPNSWISGSYIGTTTSTQLISTLNATMYITGVQLEIGSSATDFEKRPYSLELYLCRQYARLLSNGIGTWYNGGATADAQLLFDYSDMRPGVSPSIILAKSEITIADPGVANVVFSNVTMSPNLIGTASATLNFNKGAGTQTGTPTQYHVALQATSDNIMISKEL